MQLDTMPFIDGDSRKSDFNYGMSFIAEVNFNILHGIYKNR